MGGIDAYLASLGVQVRAGRGGWQPCKCPYHEDRSASASVNTTTGRFHCFVCDVNEDTIGLIRRDQGVGYVEAKRKAAQDYGSVVDFVGDEPGFSGVLSGLTRNRGAGSTSVPSWRSGLP